MIDCIRILVICWPDCASSQILRILCLSSWVLLGTVQVQMSFDWIVFTLNRWFAGCFEIFVSVVGTCGNFFAVNLQKTPYMWIIRKKLLVLVSDGAGDGATSAMWLTVYINIVSFARKWPDFVWILVTFAWVNTPLPEACNSPYLFCLFF